MGTNVSGTSDLAPLDQQADDAPRAGSPTPRTWACCTAPPSPTPSIRCTVIEGYLKELGYNVTWYRLHRHQRRHLRDCRPPLTTPTSSTSPPITPPLPTPRPLPTWCWPRRCPSLPARRASARGCGVATLSISYYDLGVPTGKMAYEILAGERRRVHHARRVPRPV